MTSNPLDFPIQRYAVVQYFYWATLIVLIFPFGLFYGVGIVLALVWILWLGRWLPQRRVEALRYWLDGSTLRVDGGLYTIHRMAIPLERITDIVLVQGPLMRHFAIWSLLVQTAGTGHATLLGLSEPEKVRDVLLQARAQLANAKSES